MNLLLFLPDECRSSSDARIEGSRAAYVRERHALKPNLAVKAGVLGGLIGEASLISDSDSGLNFQINFKNPPLLLNQVKLIVSTPRPQTIKKVICYASMLGVSELVFVRSERSQKNYLQSSNLRPENIEHEVIMALEQSATTLTPKVLVGGTLIDLVAKEPTEQLFILDGATAKSSLVTESTRSILVFGPELGFSEAERELFDSLALKRISLGARVLRVEVALVAALSRFI